MNDEKTHIPESFSASPAPARRRTGLSQRSWSAGSPGGFRASRPGLSSRPRGQGRRGGGRLSSRPGSQGEDGDGKAPLWSARNYRLEYQNSPSVMASDQSAQPGGRVSVTREPWMTARPQRGRTAPRLHRGWAGLASSPPLPSC